MTEGATDREFTITRVFDAPRELVFKAWTDPEHFTHWWGPPGSSAPLSTISMDVKPGGSWRATLVTEADGSEYPFIGVYREVVEPERLVFTLRDPQDPDNPEVVVVTVTFADLGDQTEMTLHQIGPLSEEEIPRAKEGFSSFLDSLADYLPRMKT